MCFRNSLLKTGRPVQNSIFNGAMKSYYTQYLCMVIVLFNTALHRSAFSAVSFRKLVFLSFCAFFESRHQNLRHHVV